MVLDKKNKIVFDKKQQPPIIFKLVTKSPRVKVVICEGASTIYYITPGTLKQQMPEFSKKLRKSLSATTINIRRGLEVLEEGRMINKYTVLNVVGARSHTKAVTDIFFKFAPELKCIYILTPKISFNKTNHFKKIRSIKRRSAKKYLIN